MNSIAFVSTYPPRQCGMATYTQDVLTSVRSSCRRAGVIALDDGGGQFGPEVFYRLRENEVDSYRQAADWVNHQDIDLVHLQHEYGIFGGEDGCWVLHFLERLRKPCVATFHTVLPRPTRGQRRVLSEIGRRVRKVIVMSTCAEDILEEVYGIPREKVALIRHGAPAPVDRKKARQMLEIPSEQVVISTFGLIGPGKGLEYAIEAMAEVIKHHPEAHYYILGRTHPKLLRRGPDTYRDTLLKLVGDLAIRANVHFVDRYLDLQELIQWLAATDIYVTPYPGRDQITSGTLTYAVAAGRAIVSTPYLYAQDLLGGGRGVIVEFEHLSELSGRLAGAIAGLIRNPLRRYTYEQRALAFGRSLRWPEIGRHHMRLYRSVLSEHQEQVALATRKLATLEAGA
ncbi:MAG: polysaccharide biosynthesis protein PslF [Bacillota bacterium]|nr:polysaccharide biosynthesis protein PslF [Bacillota bacterium]